MEKNLFGSPVGMYASEIAARLKWAGLWPAHEEHLGSRANQERGQALEFLSFFEDNLEDITWLEEETFDHLMGAYFFLGERYCTREERQASARKMQKKVSRINKKIKEIKRAMPSSPQVIQVLERKYVQDLIVPLKEGFFHGKAKYYVYGRHGWLKNGPCCWDEFRYEELRNIGVIWAVQGKDKTRLFMNSSADFNISSDAHNGKFPGCFIATLVFESYDCNEVMLIRRFRDRRLYTTPLGTRLLNLYYFYGPDIAGYLSTHRSVCRAIRRGLILFTRLLH